MELEVFRMWKEIDRIVEDVLSSETAESFFDGVAV